MGTVAAALVSEPGTESVCEAYNKVYQAYKHYLISLNTNTRVPYTVSLDRLNEEFNAIKTATDELKAAILYQMKELEEPI